MLLYVKTLLMSSVSPSILITFLSCYISIMWSRLLIIPNVHRHNKKQVVMNINNQYTFLQLYYARNFRLNSLCKRRLTWSPKRVDSTNQQRLPPNANAHRDVFQTRLPLQEMVKLNKCSFLSSRRHNLPSKVRLCNNQTARDVYMSMQQ